MIMVAMKMKLKNKREHIYSLPYYTYFQGFSELEQFNSNADHVYSNAELVLVVNFS